MNDFKMHGRAISFLFLVISCAALGCTPLTPMGAAHLVKHPSGSKAKGSVTSSISADYLQESGELLAAQGSGAARFSLAESYDLSAAVAKGGLLNGEGSFDLTSGSFRLSFIHGAGFSNTVNQSSGESSKVYGVFGGLFGQLNLSESGGLFFSARYGILSGEGSSVSTMGASFGYALWTTAGLQIAPELAFIQVESDDAGDPADLLISPMLSFSAPF